jgi:hypothetical protein
MDVAVVVRLTFDPCARRRFEPSTLAIENPTRFRIEHFEARVH